MGYNEILNNKDTSCPQCGDELPKGILVVVDKEEPEVGAFCDEVCWSVYFDVQDEEDPYGDVIRENMMAVDKF